MAIYNQPNMTTGIDNTLIEIATEVPAFPIGLLLFVFGFVFLSGSSSQKKRTGYSDTPMWFVMASLSTFMVAMLMTLVSGLISLSTLSIVVAITVMSGLWFFLSRGRGEL